MSKKDGVGLAGLVLGLLSGAAVLMAATKTEPKEDEAERADMCPQCGLSHRIWLAANVARDYRLDGMGFVASVEQASADTKVAFPAIHRECCRRAARARARKG